MGFSIFSTSQSEHGVHPPPSFCLAPSTTGRTSCSVTRPRTTSTKAARPDLEPCARWRRVRSCLALRDQPRTSPTRSVTQFNDNARRNTSVAELRKTLSRPPGGQGTASRFAKGGECPSMTKKPSEPLCQVAASTRRMSSGAFVQCLVSRAEVWPVAASGDFAGRVAEPALALGYGAAARADHAAGGLRGEHGLVPFFGERGGGRPRKGGRAARQCSSSVVGSVADATCRSST